MLHYFLADPNSILSSSYALEFVIISDPLLRRHDEFDTCDWAIKWVEVFDALADHIVCPSRLQKEFWIARFEAFWASILGCLIVTILNWSLHVSKAFRATFAAISYSENSIHYDRSQSGFIVATNVIILTTHLVEEVVSSLFTLKAIAMTPGARPNVVDRVIREIRRTGLLQSWIHINEGDLLPTLVKNVRHKRLTAKSPLKSISPVTFVVDLRNSTSHVDPDSPGDQHEQKCKSDCNLLFIAITNHVDN